MNTSLYTLNDRRLKQISWWMDDNPSNPGVVRFIDGDNIIDIPQDAELLGIMRPKSNVKTINVPIAIAGCEYAEDMSSETSYGYLKFKLEVRNDDGGFVTFSQFLQGIYNFYETQLTEDQYKRLLNEPKIKKRQQLFNSMKLEPTDQPKKRLHDYFAGSMFFEGYSRHDKLMLYGT